MLMWYLHERVRVETRNEITSERMIENDQNQESIFVLNSQLFITFNNVDKKFKLDIARWAGSHSLDEWNKISNSYPIN